VTLGLTEIEAEPLETALVGPGNQTDAVKMYVFEDAGFDNDQEAREHVARLRSDIRKNGAKLIARPVVFRREEDDFTAFYVSFRDRDKIMHQLTLMYFDGRVYRFTCEFLFAHGPDMDAGCKHSLETLIIKGLGDVPE
jgi:hypothetical protein